MPNSLVKSVLSNIPPSAELIKHYREKICQFENDREELLKLLNGYENLINTKSLNNEREQLHNDLEELRSALSDLNIYIHGERQQVAKLHLENELLKTNQQLTDKKIEILLHLCGLSKEQLQLYFIRCSKKLVPTLTTKGKSLYVKDIPVEPGVEETVLEKKYKILQNHYKASKNSWEQEKNSLLEDRSIRRAETEALIHQYQAHIRLLNLKVEESQRYAFEATKKAVEANSEAQRSRCKWLAEKDKLLMDVERLKKSFKFSGGDIKPNSRTEIINDLYYTQEDVREVRRLKKELLSLKKELADTENMKSLYETQHRKIEHELCHIREQKEAEIAILKEKFGKIKESKELFKKQRDKLDLRLKAQAEGFSNELKLVKTDLRKVIHQFFKLTNFYSRSEEMPDLATIKDIKLATTLARSVHHSIVEAKRKMLNIESGYCEDES